MKRKKGVLIIVRLLCCMLLCSNLVPITAHADDEESVTCELCGGERFGEWLCEGGDHCAIGYGCGDDHHCSGCGTCESEEDYCEEHGMCVNCAISEKEHYGNPRHVFPLS